MITINYSHLISCINGQIRKIGENVNIVELRLLGNFSNYINLYQ